MYYSFNDVARDYSSARASAEAEKFIAALPADFARTQRAAIVAAIGGDSSALNAIRAQRNKSDVDLSALDVADVRIGNGGYLRLRIYTPRTHLSKNRNILLYVHGGGWTINSPENCARFCRDFALKNDAVVVAPDYRLAPEHKYPAANADVKLAFDWVAAHAEEIGGSPLKLYVGGDSAGGHLAVSLTLDVLADASAKVSPAGVMAFYPAVDLRGTVRRKSFDFFGEKFCLNAELMGLFVDAYAPTQSDKNAATLLGRDFKGFPRTLIIASECDILRDEARELYSEMSQAGVPVRFVCFEGATHIYITQKGMDSAYARALGEASDFLLH